MRLRIAGVQRLLKSIKQLLGLFKKVQLELSKEVG
jgi:hypothetical protein